MVRGLPPRSAAVLKLTVAPKDKNMTGAHFSAECPTIVIVRGKLGKMLSEVSDFL